MLDTDPALPTALIDFPAQPDAPVVPDSEGVGSASRRLRKAFGRPLRWLVAHDAHQAPALMDAAHQAACDGHWCVGWLAYEAAPALNPDLPVKALPPGTPFAVWAVFAPDQVRDWPETAPALGDGAPTEAPWQLGPWSGVDPAGRTLAQIDEIRELIRQGEVYQINLTTRLQAPFEVPADAGAQPSAALHACFRALHRSQPEGYALMLDGRQAARTPGALLSVSPELFFDWHEGTVTTRPMKGTAPRHSDPGQDQAAARHLTDSPKERAENLMIVDLLRNDLSRVAATGSVRVPSLFDVQALPTVWQMTSTVQARSRPGLKLSELLGALFPCGSVTGAPKRQAMHHIARMESRPRGPYCGAAGLMQPGGRVTFNVPIRTVTLDTLPPPAPWQARCGIGSGITLDAEPQLEWQEWQAKQAFLQRAAAPFQLLESLRLDHGEIPRLDRHLARLARSARHFGFPWHDSDSPTQARARLEALALRHPQGVHKLRLLLDAQGRWQAEAAPLPPSPAPAEPRTVALARQPMPRAALDEFIRHKTTQRQAYAPFVAPAGCFDTLLWNEAGELTEFTIGNLALKLDGLWHTPPRHCGLLPGVMRETLLAEGRLHERVLTRDDLPHAQGLALINSVRGWVDVTLRPDDRPGVKG